MKDKKKKIIILSFLIVIIVIAIVACIFIFKKSDNKQEKPNNNPNQSGENNKPNNNDKDDSNNNNSDDDNHNDDNNNNNENPNEPGDNSSENENQGGTTTPTQKKLRIYSCRRTKSERGVEVVDSLSFRYHIEDGLLSDEVIVTIRQTDESGSSRIDYYKRWMEELKQITGITIKTTASGDKTVFSIKTDYKKIDYTGIDFDNPDRIRFYNDIRAKDSLEVITSYLNATGYTCQPPKEA